MIGLVIINHEAALSHILPEHGQFGKWEKMLVHQLSTFFFSHNVFESPPLQGFLKSQDCLVWT